MVGMPPNLVSSDSDTYAVAAIPPDISYATCLHEEIVWFKVKGKATMSRVMDAVDERFGQRYKLNLLIDPNLTWTSRTRVNSLDILHHHIVLFTTKRADASPSSAVRNVNAMTSPRTPLQLLGLNTTAPTGPSPPFEQENKHSMLISPHHPQAPAMGQSGEYSLLSWMNNKFRDTEDLQRVGQAPCLSNSKTQPKQPKHQ